MLGFYVVNKPVNMNSTKVVSIVKKVTKEKCGHLGTLDPLAEGVLPVAVGRATKLFDWFLSKDKLYYAEAEFGKETDTLDLAGVIIKTSDKIITKQQIDAVIDSFIGKNMQVPPKYSAVNVNGQRAYDLSRKGEEFTLVAKPIEIYSIKCDSIGVNRFSFVIHASAGTYVRALIRDIAYSLNTVATTTCIKRLASGTFKIEDACSIEDIESGTAKLISIDKALPLEKKIVDDKLFFKLSNGQTVIIDWKDGDYLCYNNSVEDNNILGVVSVKNKHAKTSINLR